ncbi:MAG: hypothetical protein J0L53_05775 [Spirochaetes bacterium]|nr:hypothetical protein [Spirochaetota bacterium]
MRSKVSVVVLATFMASCTATNQMNAFLDAETAKLVVFSDDFESGLGKWTQSGSAAWTTGTPAANGVALISPTSASANTFTISTVNNIDLTSKSNCRLQYDVRYSFSGTAGVFGQILFAGNVVGEFKNTSTAAALNSAGVFVTRTTPLPAVSGKIAIVTAVATSTTADVRIDNITLGCGNVQSSPYTLTLDNFEGGAGNWTLNSNWALTAAVGVGGSNAIKATNGFANSPMIATYQPNINLQGRAGCTLKYYYSQVGSSQGINSIDLYVNGLNIRKDFASVASLNVSQFLTIFETNSTNSLYFACNIPANNGQTAPCTIDNVILSCQQ